MRLTARQLNRATLDRQLLLARQPLAAPDGVRRVVALQAQEPASPYLALWTRLEGFRATDLDAAFADGDVVKASLMRITLHAVHAADYPAFHAAMAWSLRSSRLGDPRFTMGGLTIADVDAMLPDLLAWASTPRSKAEFEAWLEDRLGPDAARPTWWALRTFAPLHQAAVGATWTFGLRSSFRTAPERLPVEARDASIAWLARRYLDAFGPATPEDLAQFTRLRRAPIRDAIRSLGDEIVIREGPDGAPLYDLAGRDVPPDTTRAPARLLPMWDSVLLAYANRSRVIPPAYRRLVIRSNGDTLPTLLVDGHVAGVWRPVEDGIEATAFHALDDVAWAGLEAEARSLVAFLADREPLVYRRYGRWWTSLPAAEVRVLR
jgi:hypothetical protein